MKIIDLLNKIANGEEVPERIKHYNLIFEYVDGGYYNSNYGFLFDNYYVDGILNDEVEILDEPKEETPIFKKVDGEWYANKEMIKWLEKQFSSNLNNKQDKIEKLKPIEELITSGELQTAILETQLKVNELIDEVNKLKENK